MSNLINGTYYPGGPHKIARESYAYQKLLEKRWCWLTEDIEDEETKNEISIELDRAKVCNAIPKKWIEELTNIKDENLEIE